MNKFSLGQIVATQGVAALMENIAVNVLVTGFIRRHARGDWGELSDHDKQVNEDALQNEGRIMSSYTMPDNTKIWIITEGDRSVTTILLPGEY